MMSYFGRLNYDYKQRYLLEGNLRYDGSSKFRPENRWQFFWGVSGGWRLSEESFMHSLSSVVNNLKLRLSYGVLGNQSVMMEHSYIILLLPTEHILVAEKFPLLIRTER